MHLGMQTQSRQHPEVQNEPQEWTRSDFSNFEHGMVGDARWADLLLLSARIFLHNQVLYGLDSRPQRTSLDSRENEPKKKETIQFMDDNVLLKLEVRVKLLDCSEHTLGPLVPPEH